MSYRETLTNLRRFGAAGWCWSIRQRWGGFEDLEVTTCYRTDENGMGLWELLPRRNKWELVAGAGTFSLPSDKPSARRMIKNWHI